MIDVLEVSNDTTFATAVNATTTVAGLLSVLGCIFVIFSLVYLQKLQQQFWRLLLSLSVVDLFTDGTMMYSSVGQLLPGYARHEIECHIQGFLVVVFCQVGTIYVLVITIWIYRASTNKDQADWTWKTELAVHSLVWVFPLTLGIIPLLEVGGISYTPNDTSWCWVNGDPIYARFVLFYANNWANIIMIIVLRVLVWRHNLNNEMMDFIQPDRGTPVFNHLFWYPLTWVIIWLPATMNGVVQVFVGEFPALTFFHCLFVPLQGAVNAVIFVSTTNLMTPFKNRWYSNGEYLYLKSVNTGIV